MALYDLRATDPTVEMKPTTPDRMYRGLVMGRLRGAVSGNFMIEVDLERGQLPAGLPQESSSDDGTIDAETLEKYPIFWNPTSSSATTTSVAAVSSDSCIIDIMSIDDVNSDSDTDDDGGYKTLSLSEPFDEPPSSDTTDVSYTSSESNTSLFKEEYTLVSETLTNKDKNFPTKCAMVIATTHQMDGQIPSKMSSETEELMNLQVSNGDSNKSFKNFDIARSVDQVKFNEIAWPTIEMPPCLQRMIRSIHKSRECAKQKLEEEGDEAVEEVLHTMNITSEVMSAVRKWHHSIVRKAFKKYEAAQRKLQRSTDGSDYASNRVSRPSDARKFHAPKKTVRFSDAPPLIGFTYDLDRSCIEVTPRSRDEWLLALARQPLPEANRSELCA